MRMVENNASFTYLNQCGFSPASTNNAEIQIFEHTSPITSNFQFSYTEPITDVSYFSSHLLSSHAKL